MKVYVYEERMYYEGIHHYFICKTLKRALEYWFPRDDKKPKCVLDQYKNGRDGECRIYEYEVLE